MMKSSGKGKNMMMQEKDMGKHMNGHFKNMGNIVSMPTMGGKGPKKTGNNKNGKSKVRKGN